MVAEARFTGPLIDLDTVVVFDDFWVDRDDQQWIDTITDSGSVAVGDARKGIMTLTPSDGSVVDNDEVYMASANEVFLWVSGKPLYFTTYIQFTETSSGVYNAIAGFQNAVAADSLVDDGGGPRASGSYAVIYKVDGGTVWRCQSRTSSTTTDTVSTTTAGGASYQKLEIIVNDFDSTNMQVLYKVNGQYLKDSNNQTIKHFVPISGATEMQAMVGAKLGASTNNDLLLCDYIYAHQLR